MVAMVTVPQRTWSRYWDIQRSTVQVVPSVLSKVGLHHLHHTHTRLYHALFIVTHISVSGTPEAYNYYSCAAGTIPKPSLLQANTGLQLLLVGLTVGAPLVGAVGHPLLQGLW